MNIRTVDRELVRAAFALAGEQGWQRVSVAAAARRAGIDLSRARLRFSSTMDVVARFWALADAASLGSDLAEGSVKDRLFEILMRRVDFLQLHRAGVKALMRSALLDPALSLYLTRQTLISMGWVLEGAGVSAQGLAGQLRCKGLAMVWAWTIRAWLRDESEDLSATMASLDAALGRADQVVRGLPTGLACIRGDGSNVPSDGRAQTEMSFAVPDSAERAPD